MYNILYIICNGIGKSHVKIVGICYIDYHTIYLYISWKCL